MDGETGGTVWRCITLVSNKLKHELDVVFGSNEQDIVDWINTAIPALEGKKPIELLLKEDGEKVVLDCLDKMKYGDF
jgi:uncharacterized protein (DUF2384 family)